MNACETNINVNVGPSRPNFGGKLGLDATKKWECRPLAVNSTKTAKACPGASRANVVYISVQITLKSMLLSLKCFATFP